MSKNARRECRGVLLTMLRLVLARRAADVSVADVSSGNVVS